MFIATILLAAQAPVAETVLTTSVVEAAVFKPGLVYVVREVTVPAGTGLYRLDRVPQAFEGTLWYGSPDGAKVSELRTTIDLNVAEGEREIKSIPELLIANVGKSLRLTMADTKGRESVTGLLLSISRQGNDLTLRLSNGAFRQVAIGTVIEAAPSLGVTRYSPKGVRVDLRFRAMAERPSHVRFTSLEVGAAWVANYRLDLRGETGRLEASAELGLGDLVLGDTKVRLATGMPNLSSNSNLDLSVGASSLHDYLAGGQGSISRSAIDPYDLAASIATNGGNRQGTVMMGENPGQFINFISYDPSDNSLVLKKDLQSGFGINRPNTEGGSLPQFMQNAIRASRNEDLHTYDFGAVTLPAGGRITRILSDTDVPTHTIYRWQADSGNGFERVLRVHNTSKAPWPSGLIILQSDGLPLAQVPMPFTAVDHDASLELGVAEDILHSLDVHELSRRSIQATPRTQAVEVTNEATLDVTNTRATQVEAEIVYNVTGTVADPGGGTLIQRAQSDARNPSSVVTWHITLAPGEQNAFKVRFTENLP